MTDYRHQSHAKEYRCLSHTCHPNELCHIYTVASHKHGHSNSMESKCIDKPSNPFYCVDHNSMHRHGGCYCNSSDCVNKTVNSHVSVSAGFKCLSKTCNSHDVCHIRMLTNGKRKTPGQSTSVHSFCHDSKPLKPFYCVDHDSIYRHDGCYCNTTDCVRKTAIHFDGVSCPANQILKIHLNHGTVKAACHNEAYQLPRCHQPFIPGKSQQPCFCSTQQCADNLQAHTTTTHSTSATTTPTTSPTTSPATSPTTSPAISPTTFPTTSPTISSTTSTTTPTTSPTTPPHTSQTTSPSTSPTISPTTSPTTATPATTKTIPRRCNKCGDQDFGIPCSMRQINMDLPDMCSPGYNYCMTDIIQDSRGNIDVFKRCADKATCEKEWINETADLDYCTRYGAVKNTAPFECHFCCEGDMCNTYLLQNSTTWYIKSHK